MELIVEGTCAVAQTQKAPAIFFSFENKWDWLKVRPQQGVKILRSATTKNMIQLIEGNTHTERERKRLAFSLTISSRDNYREISEWAEDFSPYKKFVAFVPFFRKCEVSSRLCISHEINVAIYFSVVANDFPITFIVNNDQNVGKRRLIQATQPEQKQQQTNQKQRKKNGPQRSAGAQTK